MIYLIYCLLFKSSATPAVDSSVLVMLHLRAVLSILLIAIFDYRDENTRFKDDMLHRLKLYWSHFQASYVIE